MPLLRPTWPPRPRDPLRRVRASCCCCIATVSPVVLTYHSPNIPLRLHPSRKSDSSRRLLSRKWQDPSPHPPPNPQSSQRDDVTVFGCQSTTRSLSPSRPLSVASNLSLGVAPFTLQEAGNRLTRPSLDLLCAGCTIVGGLRALRLCGQEKIGGRAIFDLGNGVAGDKKPARYRIFEPSSGNCRQK